MPDPSALERLLLAEYDALKTEQRDRIRARDQLLPANLGAIAAVLAAVILHTGPPGLLLLPPVSLVLGWTYMRNDRHVAHIKLYIRVQLGPRATKLAGEPVFEWENGPRRRRSAQLLIELVTFAGPALAALIGFATLVDYNMPAHGQTLAVIWLAELAATSMFTGATLIGNPR